jgi:hypothetical protein
VNLTCSRGIVAGSTINHESALRRIQSVLKRLTEIIYISLAKLAPRLLKEEKPQYG